MIVFVARRLVQSIGVMLVVALIAFVLFQYVGDPLAALLGPDVPVADRDRLRRELGLDAPVITQYLRFVGDVLQGRFGMSYQMGQPVAELIASRIPATLELSLAAALFTLVLGIPMGVWAALHRGRLLGKVILTVSLVGISLPSFFVGILLIYVFAVQLGLVPSFGRGQVVALGWWTTSFMTWSGVKSLILPAVTLGLFQLAFLIRLVRSEMVEVLKADFIRFGRARGLRARTLHYRHALKNTLVPVITITGLQIGSLTAFAIITESVFQWPGVGLLFISAIRDVDIPIMSTYLILVGLFFVIVNLVVDLLYFAVDPRLHIRRADVYE
jgi:peptide/nickel transport system permease protein